MASAEIVIDGSLATATLVAAAIRSRYNFSSEPIKKAVNVLFTIH